VAPSEPLNFEKHRAETLPRLEELYKLTDEEVEEARLEPDKALPKLAARLHYEVTTAVFNSVLGSLPQFVHQTLEVRKAETAAEDSFFSRWPDLKDEKHKPVVVNSIKAYRQANPRATMAEVIDRAGLMAMLSLGINPQPQQPQQQQPQAVPQPMPVPPLGAGAGGAPFAPRRMTSSEDDVIAGLIDAEQRGELY
jgi:hypothetical protein